MQRNVEGEYKPVAWWDDLGYPSFEEEEKDDFPRTGQVVKHYRENKMDDAGHAWTQIKLAKALKISESAVVEIENLDVRLGIDRRERLCQLLDIPPILLGIRTRAEIQRLVEERRSQNGAPVVSSAPSPFWWVTLGYPQFAPGKRWVLSPHRGSSQTVSWASNGQRQTVDTKGPSQSPKP